MANMLESNLTRGHEDTGTRGHGKELPPSPFHRVTASNYLFAGGER